MCLPSTAAARVTTLAALAGALIGCAPAVEATAGAVMAAEAAAARTAMHKVEYNMFMVNYNSSVAAASVGTGQSYILATQKSDCSVRLASVTQKPPHAGAYPHSSNPHA